VVGTLIHGELNGKTEGKEAMKIYQMADRIRYPRMTTAQLRETFLVEDLFQPGQIETVYVDLDRTVIGSAVPLDQPLLLEADNELKAAYFTERRELGVLNIGGKGKIEVEDQRYELDRLDCLYIGRGNEHISFMSDNPNSPAEFYLLSYLAHITYVNQLSKASLLERTELGSPETSNKRTIRKHIHLKGTRSCQLVMGFTELTAGSVWNTMPAHTHMRRSEVYFYFNLPPDGRVLHLMGPPEETRHLIVANKQVVISPGWSIHAGAGTSSYTFCWGMGGENQAYDDMDTVKIADLR
jgi:4-deoxy-L-threo-5-hexosulose-uronate ketol-isomerase